MQPCRRTADEAGVTASQLSGLQSILGKLGVSSADTGNLLSRLNGAMLDAKAGGTDAAAAFQAAGIAFQSADGSLRPTIDVLQDIERYLKGTASEADKTALATAALGQQLGGEFVQAVKNSGSALDNMRVATDRLGSAITDDLARAAQNGIESLNRLYDRLNIIYSRAKELAGLSLGPSDQKNVAQAHLDEAKGAIKSATNNPFTGGKVDEAQASKLQADLFKAADEFAKANPIATLSGGYPGIKPAAAPAAASSGDDAEDTPTAKGRGGTKSKSAGSGTDRVDTVITDLARQAAAERGLASAVGETTAEKQRSLDLEKAQQAASERGSALTDAERAKVIALADSYTQAHQAVEQFTAQQKAAGDAAKALSSSFETSIEGLLLSGNTLKSTLAGLLKTLESAGFKALLTGEGPLAGLLGTAPKAGATGVASVGGLFGGIASLFHLADGGRVVGAGTGTSDSVPAMLSHGEYVINAAASSKNAGLLAAINSGRAIHLAAGGMVGSMPAIPAAVAASGGGSLSVTHAPVINMTPAQGVTPEQVARAIAQNQKSADRQILSTISAQRRRFIGG